MEREITMTIITEDYVSFEVAKLLKEKGFDCACKVWYSEYTSQFGDKKYTSIEFDNHNKFNENYKFICSAPTLQMAMKWLREVHKIFIEIVHLDENKHTYYLYRYYSCQHERYVQHTNPNYPTYEQACEEAIKYCIENLI